MAEEEIDYTAALEEHMAETLEEERGETEETEEELEAKEEEQHEEETEEEVETFNLDAAINEATDSDQHLDLTDKLTDEQAAEEATKRGWRAEGKDRFGHKLTAVEFLERSPFVNTINKIRDEVKQTKEQLSKVLKQNEQIAKKSIADKKQMVEDFEKEKQELLNGEYLDEDQIKRVKEIDEGIKKAGSVETDQQETEGDESLSENEQKIVNEYANERESFVKANDWYETDYQMTKKANEIYDNYIYTYSERHGYPPIAADAFNHVENQIKREFPDKPKRTTRVSNTTRRVTTANKVEKKALKDYDEDIQNVAKEVMEATGMSETDYLKTYNP